MNHCKDPIFCTDVNYVQPEDVFNVWCTFVFTFVFPAAALVVVNTVMDIPVGFILHLSSKPKPVPKSHSCY